MPPKKKPKFLYSEESMKLAVEAVKKGESGFSASKRFQVPRSTLMNKVEGKSPLDRKMGPSPIFGKQGEQLLVNWVKALAVRGFPVWKGDLIRSVQQIISDTNVPNNFVNGKPGKKWLSLFLKRHPDIATRTVEKLSQVRACVTEGGIKKWFNEVSEYLHKEDLMDILKDPSRVFNADETCFQLCPKSDKVLGIKGQKNVYEVVNGPEKENITLLANVSADGEIAPSMVVFPGARLPQGARTCVPGEWSIAKSEKGWMNGEIFYEYVANIFSSWILEHKIKLPVIMFLDGHASHLTYHLSKFCAQNQIILIALHPNSTHILQPLDVAIFGPLKHHWSESVHQWRIANAGQRLTKYNFSFLVKKVMDETITRRVVENGFKRCGLCPWNPDAVDYSKVDIHNNNTYALKEKPAMCKLPVPCTNVTKCKQFVEALEIKIDIHTLNKFKETYAKFTPVWMGEERSQDLYVVWKRALDELNEAEKLPTGHFEVVTPEVEVLTNTTPEKTSGIEVQNQLENGFEDNQPSTSAAAVSENLLKALSPETGGKGVPSPFKKHLFWPGTPKKSNKKRNVAKMPSVVSSTKWQEYEEKKREEKENKEREKNERRQKRELSKKEKVEKKQSKGKKKANIIDEDQDWKCKICGDRYSSELIRKFRKRWIECDQCKNQFHYNCLPKKHLDEYGLDEDDDDEDEVAFVCHKCVEGEESELAESMDEDEDEMY